MVGWCCWCCCMDVMKRCWVKIMWVKKIMRRWVVNKPTFSMDGPWIQIMSGKKGFTLAYKLLVAKYSIEPFQRLPIDSYILYSCHFYYIKLVLDMTLIFKWRYMFYFNFIKIFHWSTLSFVDNLNQKLYFNCFF